MIISGSPVYYPFFKNPAVPYNTVIRVTAHHIYRFQGDLQGDGGSSGPFQEILHATRWVEDVRKHRVSENKHPDTHKIMERPLAEDLPDWNFWSKIPLKQGEKGSEGSYLEKTNGRALASSIFSFLPSISPIAVHIRVFEQHFLDRFADCL